jgi:hypothetical protein
MLSSLRLSPKGLATVKSPDMNDEVEYTPDIEV